MIDRLKQRFPNLLSLRMLSVWALCAVLIAAAGPFGTYQAAAFPVRLFYWALVIFSAALGGRAGQALAGRWLGPGRPLARDLLLVAMMAVAYTPVLWALTSLLLFGGFAAGPALLPLALLVAALAAGICVLRRLLSGIEPPQYFDFGGMAPPTETPPRLLRRLPPEFSGPMLRLAARDHFVDVIAAESTHSLRMRLADAIDEMDPVPGHPTHRSHWVACAAIAGVEREGGRTQLRLVNGDLVPVSRKYKAALEDVGVL